MTKRAHFHAVYNLKYHLVLVTKYRKECINREMIDRLEEIFREQCEKWQVDIVEFSGEADHVHLLIDAHPSMELSRFINSIKTVSSRLVRKEFGDHLSKYYWKPFFWTRAYCLLSSGGAPIDIIQQYIKNQERPE
jgi:putative transposase